METHSAQLLALVRKRDGFDRIVLEPEKHFVWISAERDCAGSVDRAHYGLPWNSCEDHPERIEQVFAVLRQMLDEMENERVTRDRAQDGAEAAKRISDHRSGRTPLDVDTLRAVAQEWADKDCSECKGEGVVRVLDMWHPCHCTRRWQV